VISGVEVDVSGPFFFQMAKKRERLEAEMMAATNDCLARGNELIQENLPTESSMVGLGDSWQIVQWAQRLGNLITGALGSTHPGAALREFGHRGITPGKNAVKAGPRKGQMTRALTIPINPMKRGKGLSTVIGILAAAGGTAKGGTFSQSGYSRGGAWTYEKQGIDLFPIYRPEYRRVGTPGKPKKPPKKTPGKAHGFVPIFVLATKVVVGEHPYVRPAMDKLRLEAREIFADAVIRSRE